MNSSCKTLGDILQIVDDRNKDEITNEVLGISIDKEFMPSVANVIGTDLSKYKLLKKGYFACNSMHTGRDGRLPIALYRSDKPAIVSPAYFMFKVKENVDVDLEYLMMWFQRPEFDRLCWFMTDASVRGGLSWEDLCRIKINLPSADEQKKTVCSYHAITNRISVLSQMIDNLEAQAQAIFAEYISTEESTGCFGDLIEETIPGDWGSDKPEKNSSSQVICFRGADMPSLNIGITSEAPIRYILPKNYETKRLQANDFIVEISGGSPTQSTGRISMLPTSVIEKHHNAVICSNFCKGVRVKKAYAYFFFMMWKRMYANRKMFDYENGTTGLKNFDFDTFVSMEKIYIPPIETVEKLNGVLNPIYVNIVRNGFEIEVLAKLKDLLLPHMMRI